MKKKFLKVRFERQEGYGAFSYYKIDLKNIINYIQNQEKHHAKVTFKQEFILLLVEYGLEYDLNYLFQDPI
jgi:putative transposase